MSNFKWVANSWIHCSGQSTDQVLMWLRELVRCTTFHALGHTLCWWCCVRYWKFHGQEQGTLFIADCMRIDYSLADCSYMAGSLLHQRVHACMCVCIYVCRIHNSKISRECSTTVSCRFSRRCFPRYVGICTMHVSMSSSQVNANLITKETNSSKLVLLLISVSIRRIIINQLAILYVHTYGTLFLSEISTSYWIRCIMYRERIQSRTSPKDQSLSEHNSRTTSVISLSLCKTRYYMSVRATL